MGLVLPFSERNFYLYFHYLYALGLLTKSFLLFCIMEHKAYTDLGGWKCSVPIDIGSDRAIGNSFSLHVGPIDNWANVLLLHKDAKKWMNTMLMLKCLAFGCRRLTAGACTIKNICQADSNLQLQRMDLFTMTYSWLGHGFATLRLLKQIKLFWLTIFSSIIWKSHPKC